MNKVVLTGRLTKDPELKKTNSGISYCFFTIAVNRSYVSRQGNREADFINCVAWRVQAENLARYMRKGSLIGVDGEVRTRSYQDQDNKMVYITEILANAIEFLESKSAGSSQGYQSFSQDSPFEFNQKPEPRKQEDPFKEMQAGLGITDDDIPF